MDYPQGSLERYALNEEISLGDNVKEQDMLFVVKGAVEIQMRNQFTQMEASQEELSPWKVGPGTGSASMPISGPASE